MQEYKLVRDILVVFLLIGATFPINHQRMLDDFICDTGVTVSTVSLSGTFATVPFSFGFWLKVPASQVPTGPVFYVKSTINPSITLEITYTSAMTYTMYRNTVSMFTFSAASSLDDAAYYSIRRTATNNNWNYFSFMYENHTGTKRFGIALNSNAADYGTYAVAWTQATTSFIIGNTVSGSTCNAKFHVHRFEVFDQAYNPASPTTFNAASMYSAKGGPLAALYKLNRYVMMEALINVINQTTFKATISNKAISRLAMNFPKEYQDNRVFFDGAGFTITYPNNLLPKSPTVNSYTFSCSFMTLGLPYLKYVRIYTTVPNTYYELVFYQRSPSSSSTTQNIAVKYSVTYTAWNRVLELIVDGISAYQNNKLLATPSADAAFFPDTLRFVTLQVENHILKTPDATICFFSTYACSTTQAISSVFADDDIHTTILKSQSDFFFYRLYFYEISLAYSSGFKYNAGTGFQSDNTKSPVNIFYVVAIYDIRRFLSNSITTLTFTTFAESSVWNCASLTNCEYCEAGVCYLCYLHYYLSGGTCQLCGGSNVYDFVTRQCITTSVTITGTIAGLDTVINNLAQTNPVVMNIFFGVDSTLASASYDPMNFCAYFNSLQSLTYQPYENIIYTPAQIATELARITAIIAEHQSVLTSFGAYQNYQINYAPITTQRFKIPNPDLIPTGNKCYSIIHTYIPTNAYEGVCGVGCVIGRYWDIVTLKCETCPTECLSCTSYTVCTACNSGYTLIGSACLVITISTPGTVAADNSPPGPYNTAGSSSPLPTSDDQENLSSYSATVSVNEIQNIIMTKQPKTLSINKPNNNELLALICKMGYGFNLLECQRCPFGCLSCPDLLVCTKCDSNFLLSEDDLCIQTHGVVSEEKVSKLSDPFSCKYCYQNYDFQAPGCETCRRECPCYVKSAYNDKSFGIVCNNATLDTIQVPLIGFNRFYYLKAYHGDFDFRVYLKRDIDKYDFAINPMLVKNTTGCTVPEDDRFKLNAFTDTGIYVAFSLPAKPQRTLSLIGEATISTISLISFPLANSVIGFIQFNKFFFYLSTMRVKVGGLFDYVNYNFYDQDDPEIPWFWAFTQEIEFTYINWWFYAKKLVPIRTVLLFVCLVAFCKILARVGIQLKRKEDMKKLFQIGSKIESKGKKTLFVVHQKYLHVFIACLSYVFRVAYRTTSRFYKALMIIVMFLLLHFPIMIIFKLKEILESKDPAKGAFLNSLQSPNEFEKNRALIKAKIIEDLFFVVKAVSVYLFRHYPLIALILSQSLLLIQIGTTLRFASKIHVAQSIIVSLELIAVTGFVLLMMLKHLEIDIHTIIFDIFYVTSNILKLISSITDFALVLAKNRVYLKKVAPHKRSKNNPASRSPSIEIKEDENIADPSEKNLIILSSTPNSRTIKENADRLINEHQTNQHEVFLN